MQAQTLIVATIAGLAGWAVIALSARRRDKAKAARTPRHALLNPLGPEPHARLEPERRFVVRLSDTEVLCERPDGRVERVAWADLEKVEIVTTDEGPFVPDVFWVLHGAHDGCSVPQGATGEGELLARLQALPRFDNEAVIQAMSTPSAGRFLCWQRPA